MRSIEEIQKKLDLIKYYADCGIIYYFAAYYYAARYAAHEASYWSNQKDNKELLLKVFYEKS